MLFTPVMEQAVLKLEATLTAIELRTPWIPIISNINAKLHSNPEAIKKILANPVTI